MMECNPTSNETHFNMIVSPLQGFLLNGRSIEKIEKILREDFGAKLSSQKDKIRKCKEIIQVCLDLKINLNLPEDKYSTLLHFAANKLDDGTFKSVLNRSAHFNINALYQGKSLLHFVTEQGKENLVQDLLEFGADVNVKDVHQETPLFYAILKNIPSLVRLLLNYEADMHFENFMLGSSSPVAIWSLDKQIVEILLEAGYDVSAENNGILPTERITPLNWSKIKLFCAHGADINLNTKSGTKLLHYFCRWGRLDDVQLSVKYGADLFSTENGMTALHSAVFANNFDLVDFLLCNGLDINARDSKNGETPLHLLSKFENNHISGPVLRGKRTKEFLNMVEFLVDNGADVNAFDKNFFTPLANSISLNLLPMSECFLELKASLDFRPKRNINNTMTVPFHSYFISFLAISEDEIPRHIQELYDLTIIVEIKSLFKDCKNLVNLMKNSKICHDINISFFDFLTKDLMKVANFPRNAEIMAVFEAGEYKKVFPFYVYLLGKRIERVQLMRNYINVIRNFFYNLFQKHVPIVLDVIISFLRTEDLRNFARALRISEDFPNGKYFMKSCV